VAVQFPREVVDIVETFLTSMINDRQRDYLTDRGGVISAILCPVLFFDAKCREARTFILQK